MLNDKVPGAESHDNVTWLTVALVAVNAVGAGHEVLQGGMVNTWVPVNGLTEDVPVLLQTD